MTANNAVLNSLWLCVPGPLLRYVTPMITLALDFPSWGLENERCAGEGPALAWHADRPVGRRGQALPSLAGQIPPVSLRGVRRQAVSFKRLGLGPFCSQVPRKCPEVVWRKGSVPCRFCPSSVMLFLQETSWGSGLQQPWLSLHVLSTDGI